ncbi:MAG: IS1595 family transposase [Patescibacteria group bacterium]
MNRRITCFRCGSKKLYKIRRGKRRCFDCGYEFTPWLIRGLRLSKKSWRKIAEWFVLERSGWWIAQEVGLGKNQTYRALNKIRQLITFDVPDVFSGTVEVDETYLGGQKKNKRKSQLKKDKAQGRESKKGFGTTKQPVFGILCRSGKVFAKLVDETEAKDLIPIITKKVSFGTRICSDTWRAYTGLAAKGYVHRTVEHRKKEYAKGKNHINGLEGFWGYLKRKLAAKGGVRRKYLSLFLGEYVWRYNNRKTTTKEQTKKILELLKVSG